MRSLFDILQNNPVLVFIVLAWVAGMVGNVVKAARKRGERAEQQRRMPSAPASTPAANRPTAAQKPSSDDIAAEMRRILGMDPPARPASPPPLPATSPQPKPRRLVGSERPPTPVMPSVSKRSLESQVHAHVDPRSGSGSPARDIASRPRIEASTMGTLGGRVQRYRRAKEVVDRFPRSNLRQAVVLNEILGPPLALRRQDPERLQ